MKDSAVNCNARVPDSPAQPCGISGWGFKDGGSRAMICLPLMPGVMWEATGTKPSSGASGRQTLFPRSILELECQSVQDNLGMWPRLKISNRKVRKSSLPNSALLLLLVSEGRSLLLLVCLTLSQHLRISLSAFLQAVVSRI